MAKQAKTIVAVALPLALENIAEQFAGVLHESQSVSVTLGELTREAHAAGMTAELIQPFTDGVRQLAVAQGLDGDSLKVYLSNVRGVLRAMQSGYEPAEGLGLRAMYDGIPEELRGTGANKGGKRKARQPEGKDDAGKDDAGRVNAVNPVPATKADVIRALFGFHTPELQDAVEYAVEHAGIFQTWAKASAKAAQTVAPLRKAA